MILQKMNSVMTRLRLAAQEVNNFLSTYSELRYLCEAHGALSEGQNPSVSKSKSWWMHG